MFLFLDLGGTKAQAPNCYTSCYLHCVEAVKIAPLVSPKCIPSVANIPFFFININDGCIPFSGGPGVFFAHYDT